MQTVAAAAAVTTKKSLRVAVRRELTAAAMSTIVTAMTVTMRGTQGVAQRWLCGVRERHPSQNNVPWLMSPGPAVQLSSKGLAVVPSSFFWILCIGRSCGSVSNLV